MGHDQWYGDNTPKPAPQPQPKCIGLWGRLFGHKFDKEWVGTAALYNNGCCWRCGFNPKKVP